MSIRDRTILSAPADLDIQRDDGRYQIGLCDGGQRTAARRRRPPARRCRCAREPQRD